MPALPQLPGLLARLQRIRSMLRRVLACLYSAQVYTQSRSVQSRLTADWPDDPIVIEIGVRDADVALGMREIGAFKYLGISGDGRRIQRLKAGHAALADQFIYAKHRRVALHNNADVLVLSGLKRLYLWRFRAVRHAQFVAWKCGFSLLTVIALIGCLCHLLGKHYEWPQLVRLPNSNGESTRLFISRICRRKNCYRNSLHFIPHGPGLSGLFRQFDAQGVRYVVLRWFDQLPNIDPLEDVDLLVDDRSLPTALAILHALPGIQPCDVYSATGLAKSDYCGNPYYPEHVARRILENAVCHRRLCWVPNSADHFHSLAYHAVYHKGTRSGLPLRGPRNLNVRRNGHDYSVILQRLSNELGIDVEISLEGLHAYLQRNGWSPAPEFLARLAIACPRNDWLQTLSKRLDPPVHDQGLAVFVLRQEAIRHGFKEIMIDMIRSAGFEVLAIKTLTPTEIEYSAARTRGGDWSAGPYESAGGPPAACVITYDRDPLPPSRRQRRKFPLRTNARIFIKEAIRDAILARLPCELGCNALHSSDHAAEAWHLIEVLAPEYLSRIRERLDAMAHGTAALTAPQVQLQAGDRAA